MEQEWRMLRTWMMHLRRQIAADLLPEASDRAMGLLRCDLDTLMLGVLYRVGGKKAVHRVRSGCPNGFAHGTGRYELRTFAVDVLEASPAWSEIERRFRQFCRQWLTRPVRAGAARVRRRRST